MLHDFVQHFNRSIITNDTKRKQNPKPHLDSLSIVKLPKVKSKYKINSSAIIYQRPK